MEKLFNGYSIAAHQSCIEDLPPEFIKALQVSMHDISYANDPCARFAMIHPEQDKAYHLWVDMANRDEREETGLRFSFTITHLDPACVYQEGSSDYLGGVTTDEFATIVVTEQLDSLVYFLCKALPNFKAEWQESQAKPTYVINQHGYTLCIKVPFAENKLVSATLIHDEDEAEACFRERNGISPECGVFIPSMFEHEGVLYCEALNACAVPFDEPVEDFINDYTI